MTMPFTIMVMNAPFRIYRQTVFVPQYRFKQRVPVIDAGIQNAHSHIRILVHLATLQQILHPFSLFPVLHPGPEGGSILCTAIFGNIIG